MHETALTWADVHRQLCDQALGAHLFCKASALATLMLSFSSCSSDAWGWSSWRNRTNLSRAAKPQMMIQRMTSAICSAQVVRSGQALSPLNACHAAEHVAWHQLAEAAADGSHR